MFHRRWDADRRASGWRGAGLYAPRTAALAIALLGLVALVAIGGVVGMVLADLLLVGALFLLGSAVAPRVTSA